MARLDMKSRDFSMAAADDVDRFERERRDADRRYNDALTALDGAVVAAQAQPAIARADVDRLATMLIVFLQQITAFVESKDREAAARASARADAIEASTAAVAELRSQTTILQRAVQA